MIPLFIGRLVDPSDVNQQGQRLQTTTTTFPQQHDREQQQHDRPPIQSENTDCMANDKCKGQTETILTALNLKIQMILEKLNTQEDNNFLIRQLKEMHNEIANLDSKLGNVLS